jgi:hypothetical protein
MIALHIFQMQIMNAILVICTLPKQAQLPLSADLASLQPPQATDTIMSYSLIGEDSCDA